MIVNIVILFILIFCLFILRRINVKKIKTYNSPLLGKIEVWQKYNGERLLTINGFSQGITIKDSSIKKSYWYKIAQQVILFCKKFKKPNILILGLGGNTTPFLIQKGIPDAYFTIVEIDDYIIKACKEWFSLDSLKKLNLINADAYKIIYYPRKINTPFDAIVIDIFNGKSGVIHTTEEKIIGQLKKLLKTHGILVFNWPANTEKTKKEAEQLVNYCKANNLKVAKDYIVDPRGYKNFVITAKTN